MFFVTYTASSDSLQIEHDTADGYRHVMSSLAPGERDGRALDRLAHASAELSPASLPSSVLVVVCIPATPSSHSLAVGSCGLVLMTVLCYDWFIMFVLFCPEQSNQQIR